MIPLPFLGATKAYDPRWFAFVRILLGTYLAYYFLRILPFGSELYSSEGMFPDPEILWTYGWFPSPFLIADSPAVIAAALIVGSALSVSLACGLFRRSSAVLLWFLSASLIVRNPLTLDPSLPYIGLLLLCLALIPPGEPLSFSRRKEWLMPASLYFGPLIVLGASYAWSAYDRLHAASWQDGSAFAYMLQLVVARDNALTHALLNAPDWLLAAQTYASVGAFALSLPFLLIPRTRPFMWLALTLAFLYAGAVFDLTQVIIGIVIFHLYLFDTAWIPESWGSRIAAHLKKITRRAAHAGILPASR